MRKPRVVHYTIGYHEPAIQGGTEAIIRAMAMATHEQYDHAVMAKNAVESYEYMRGVRPTKDFNDWDLQTGEVLAALEPDVVILYLGDGSQMHRALKCLPEGVLRVGFAQDLQAFDVNGKAFIQDLDQVWSHDQVALMAIPQYSKQVSIYWMPPALDASVFQGTDRPKGGDPCKWAYVGRFDDTHKRQMDAVWLVQAMRDRGIAECTLEVVGGGTPFSNTNVMRSVVDDLPYVHDHGWATPSQVASVMRRTGVLVIPSAQETFCIVALEALACGSLVLSNCRRGCNMSRWADPYTLNGYDYGPFSDYMYDTSKWVHKHAPQDEGVPDREAMFTAMCELLAGKVRYVNHSVAIQQQFGLPAMAERFIKAVQDDRN